MKPNVSAAASVEKMQQQLTLLFAGLSCIGFIPHIEASTGIIVNCTM